MLLEKHKFSFLYVDIWFDVAKCKFIVKNSSFKMLVVFSPIFMVDTNITFIYNFIAPLTISFKGNYFVYLGRLVGLKTLQRLTLIAFLSTGVSDTSEHKFLWRSAKRQQKTTKNHNNFPF